jgi:hypothetical protein
LHAGAVRSFILKFPIHFIKEEEPDNRALIRYIGIIFGRPPPAIPVKRIVNPVVLNKEPRVEQQVATSVMLQLPHIERMEIVLLIIRCRSVRCPERWCVSVVVTGRICIAPKVVIVRCSIQVWPLIVMTF